MMVSDERTARPITRWAFYVWMFSLPYDVIVPQWLPEVFQGILSIPRMAGIVLLLAFLCDVKLRPWKRPPAFLAIAAFLMIFALSMLRSDFTELSTVLQQFQLVILFLICYNLFASRSVTQGGLLSYAVSCGIASALALGGMSVADPTGRLGAFGANPNEYSQVLLIGTLAAIGIAYIRKVECGIPLAVLLWSVVLITMTAIAKSGSRGQTLALSIGIAALMLNKGSLRMRLRNLGLLAVIAGTGFCLLTYTDVLKDRWNDTFETGNTAGRDVITREAVQMILEKPLTGWGAAGGFELAHRVDRTRGEARAAHNMVLAMLLFTGFAGSAAYFTAYVTVLRASWWARSGVEGALPLAIFLALLIGDSVSGGLPLKLHWTFFAYQLAVGMKRPPQGTSHGIEVMRTGSSRADTRTAARQRQIASSPMRDWSNSI